MVLTNWYNLRVVNWYAFLADVVLVVHGLLVLFNLGALPIIWIGYFREWKFVRNPFFRVGHLLLMSYIAAQAGLGIDCPLTSWENVLRLKAGDALFYNGGYVAHWVGSLLFYDFSPNTFLLIYCLFFGLVLFTFFWIKPRRLIQAIGREAKTPVNSVQA